MHRLAARIVTATPAPRAISSSARAPARLMQEHLSITPSMGMQPPPPVPVPQPDRKPHPSLAPGHRLRGTKSPSVTLPRGKDNDLGAAVQLDLMLLRTLKILSASFSSSAGAEGFTSLETLQSQSSGRAGTQLPETLAYESTPKHDRKVKVNPGDESTFAEGEQEGIVVVAHVIGGEEPLVSVCSGFAVGSSEGDQQILTCQHTLDEATSHLDKLPFRPSTSLAPRTAPPSATFVLTSSGHIYLAASVASSLPASDLLILSLSATPIRNPSYTLPLATGASALAEDQPPKLKTLPLSPYPAVVGTPIATLAYTNPARKDGDELPTREWYFGRVVEYKDRAGHEAKTGTYDELASMRMTTLPRQGSSGGPIVDVDTGAVVGIIRGSAHNYGDRGAQGFATPAERVFELFQLPGFKPKSLQQAKSAPKGSAPREKQGGERSS